MFVRVRDVQLLISAVQVFGVLLTLAAAQPKNYMRLYIDGAPTDLVGPEAGSSEARALLEEARLGNLPLVVVPQALRDRHAADALLRRLWQQASADVDDELSEQQPLTAAKRSAAGDHLVRYSRNLPEQEKMYQIQHVGDLPMFRFG